MKSLDDHIMEIIREKPKCTSGEIKDELKVRDVKVAPRTVDGHIRKLRELGVIVAVLHPMKLVPAYIPADRYKEWTEVKFQERKIHSDDLKKEVIKPWLEALQPAILHENGSLGHLHFSGFGSLRRSILFKDVWNHVDPELRYGWDEFMERLNDLRDKSGKVLSVIQREIEKILSGKGGIWAEIEKRTGLEISKEFGYATVDPGLVRLVLNEALRRSQGYKFPLGDPEGYLPTEIYLKDAKEWFVIPKNVRKRFGYLVEKRISNLASSEELSRSRELAKQLEGLK